MTSFNKILKYLVLFMPFLGFTQLYGQINFSLQSQYKYLKGTEAVNLSSDWMTPAFDDSAWDTGVAPFRYGDGTGGTELTDMQGNYSTVFMRTKFDVQQLSLIKSALLTFDWDDGFILWINGFEITKQQAPATVAYDALASDLHESGVPESFTFNAADLHLVEGQNTIAVLGCNISLAGSSDFYYDMSIVAQPEQSDLTEFVDSLGLTFSKPSGFYQSSFNLTIASPVADAQIVYTLDGSNPQNSLTSIKTTATATITIDPSSTDHRGTTPAVVVRASITKNGYKPSKPEARTYIYLENVKKQTYPGWDWPDWNVNGQEIDYDMDPDVVNSTQYRNQINNALLDIPTISIITDNANLFDPAKGIYVNALSQGSAWERECSVELINPDGSPGFNVDAGLRIRGGWSRHDNYPKHAFRLFFRQDYGPGELDFPLFENEGVDHFDKVDLRCAQNYSWSNYEGEHNTFIREVFLRDAQGEAGEPYTRTRYYHLYLNGMYWGLFETQERSEARWAADYIGGDVEDWDVIKKGDDGSVLATDGTLDSWHQIYNIINTSSIDNARYFRLEGKDANGVPAKNSEILVDIDNLIDYMINIFYSGNFDAPVTIWGGNNSINNLYMLKNREDKTKGYIFMVHDAEHTMMTVGTSGPGTVGLYENRVNLAYRKDATMTKPSFYSFNPQWLHQMLSTNKEYRQRFADRVWRQFNGNGIFTENACIERLNKRADMIDMAIIGESARWGDAHTGTAYTKDNAWLPELDVLRDDYFPYRTDIVKGQLQEYDLYPSVEAPVVKESGSEIIDPKVYINGPVTINISSSDGDIYYTLNGKDPRKIGGSPAGYAIKIPTGTSLSIPESAVLKARVFKNNKWSALNEIHFIANQTDYSHFKVTELHYHPAPTIVGTDTTSGSNYEFIEFKNTGDVSAINLTGLVIDSAIYYEFPDDYLLAPQQFFVVASKPKKFYDRHGWLASGNFKKNFSNSGEEVLVTNKTGNRIIDFYYTDKFPWVEQADGKGPSMVSVEDNPSGDPNNAAYWKASRYDDGSPFYNDSDNVGVDETFAGLTNASVNIYPNPTSDIFTIQADATKIQKLNLKIIDLNGATLYQTSFANQTQISLSQLGVSYGIYFVKIEGQTISETRKMVYTPE